MSFADAFSGGNTKKPAPVGSVRRAPVGGGFAGLFDTEATAPEIQRKIQIRDLESENAVAAANTKYAQSFTGMAKNTFEAAAAPFIEGYKASAATNIPKSLNPLVAAQNGTKLVEDAYMEALNHAGDSVYQAATTLGDNHASLLKKGASVGEAALATLNPFFAAITAPLSYARAFPVIGNAADAVQGIFSAIGSGAGSHVATATVDDNPFISEETKQTIRPLVQDSAALVAQLIAGKVGGDAIGTLADKSRQILGHVGADTKANVPMEDLYHGADTATAESIKTGGFRPSTDFPGNGMVSLTGDFKEAQNYAMLGDRQGQVLKVKVNGDNVKTYPSMQAYTDAIEKAPGETAGAKETALNAPYDAVRIRVPGQRDVVFAKPDKVEVVSTEAKSLPVYGDTTLRKIPVVEQDGTTRRIDIASHYTPDEQLPSIDFGKPAKDRSGLPSIHADATPSRRIPGDFEYVPLEEATAAQRAAAQAEARSAAARTPNSFEAAFAKEPAPVRAVASAEDFQPVNAGVVPRETSTFQPGNGLETAVSRLAQRIEELAIEKKLTNTFGDLPEYTKVNWKDQTTRAANLLREDPTRAYRVALGQEMPPEGLLPGAVFLAVEDRAVRAGDILTIRRLARESTLTKRASEAGQEIGILSQRDYNSPVRIIEDVNKARQASVEKRGGGKKVAEQKKEVVDDAKKEIKKAASKRETWEEFMKNLTCAI